MKHSSDPILLFLLATATFFVMRGLLKVQFQFYYCFSSSKTLEQATQLSTSNAQWYFYLHFLQMSLGKMLLFEEYL